MLSGDAARPGKNAVREYFSGVSVESLSRRYDYMYSPEKFYQNIQTSDNPQLLTFFPDIRIFSKNSYIWVYEMD